MEQEQPKYFKCGININYLIRLHLWSKNLKQANAKYEKVFG